MLKNKIKVWIPLRQLETRNFLSTKVVTKLSKNNFNKRIKNQREDQIFEKRSQIQKNQNTSDKS